MGRVAPLRRGNAGPYQRPPPAKLTTKSAKVEDHRVALTARIRRSLTGTLAGQPPGMRNARPASAVRVVR